MGDFGRHKTRAEDAVVYCVWAYEHHQAIAAPVARTRLMIAQVKQSRIQRLCRSYVKTFATDFSAQAYNLVAVVGGCKGLVASSPSGMRAISPSAPATRAASLAPEQKIRATVNRWGRVSTAKRPASNTERRIVNLRTGHSGCAAADSPCERSGKHGVTLQSNPKKPRPASTP